ncbi:MAG: amino acid racemase [Pseudomonadota bacterium]
MAVRPSTIPHSHLTVGVLGGMGPEATVDFMSAVIGLTDAASDQDHLPMLIDNNPQVPDRQRAMRTGSTDVADALRTMALRLEAAGADFLVMPCNTAHAFLDEAAAAVSIPFNSIIDSTMDAVRAAAPSVDTVGLLATNACLKANVYQSAATSRGVELLLLDEALQERCMSHIFAIKGGDTGVGPQTGMQELAEHLVGAGAGAVIAGCTEIPLVLKPDAVRVPLISSTEALARRTVALATGADSLPSQNT